MQTCLSVSKKYRLRPPLTRGLDFAKQKTGGEKTKTLDFYIKNAENRNILSPSVTFGDSSLVRGSLGCYHTRRFFDILRRLRSNRLSPVKATAAKTDRKIIYSIFHR